MNYENFSLRYQHISPKPPAKDSLGIEAVELLVETKEADREAVLSFHNCSKNSEEKSEILVTPLKTVN